MIIQYHDYHIDYLMIEYLDNIDDHDVLKLNILKRDNDDFCDNVKFYLISSSSKCLTFFIFMQSYKET